MTPLTEAPYIGNRTTEWPTVPATKSGDNLTVRIGDCRFEVPDDHLATVWLLLADGANPYEVTNVLRATYGLGLATARSIAIIATWWDGEITAA